jgi:hypothetical protein
MLIILGIIAYFGIGITLMGYYSTNGYVSTEELVWVMLIWPLYVSISSIFKFGRYLGTRKSERIEEKK